MTGRRGDAPDADADPEDIDLALFRERTELAWHRTGIAFAALGGAMIKTTPSIGLIILAISVLIFVLGHTSRSLLLITIAVTAVSLVALVLAFFNGDPPFPPL
ncbi:MAG TPA: hypothetical protein VFU43_11065 [Streptosporangiaceae bacterium]|nr:hypothetical protein [Streptosporangiaceae bacterium]